MRKTFYLSALCATTLVMNGTQSGFAAESQPPAASQSIEPMAGALSVCPWIPDGKRIKYTCSFPLFVFSHSNSRDRDAYAENVKVQFVVDPDRADNSVETIIQGDGAGVAWALTIENMTLSYDDPAGVRRTIGSPVTPQPNYFLCRLPQAQFSAKTQSQRNLVIDALSPRSVLYLSMNVRLKTGIPGSGC